jgi:hypothetical protein
MAAKVKALEDDCYLTFLVPAWSSAHDHFLKFVRLQIIIYLQSPGEIVLGNELPHR